jgi:hypothetical protein
MLIVYCVVNCRVCHLSGCCLAGVIEVAVYGASNTTTTTTPTPTPPTTTTTTTTTTTNINNKQLCYQRLSLTDSQKMMRMSAPKDCGSS